MNTDMASGGTAGIKAVQPLYTLNVTGASAEGRRCQDHRRQWCWDNTMSKEDTNGNHSDGVPCPHCPETFDSEHAMQIHRGHVHGPNVVECDECGAEIQRPPSEAEAGGANLCSPECEREYRGFDEPIEFDCDWCGDVSIQEAHEHRRYEHHFCSAECRGKWCAEHLTGENNPRYGAGGARTVTCATCGDEHRAEAAKLRQNEHHFCDDDCYAEWLSEEQPSPILGQSGPDNPHWKGGYTKYRGTNWPKLRAEALADADYQCQGCGRHDGDHRDEHGVGLSVHHIRPVTEFDEPADADTVDNLVPLCRTCHKKWEGVPLRPIFG